MTDEDRANFRKHTDKPAQAPSEEALECAKDIREELMRMVFMGDGELELPAGHLAAMAAHVERFAAHRLSTALLNPSEEAMTYGRAYLIGCLFAAGWSDVEFRKIPVEALQTAFDASFRAAAMKITGRTN